MRYLLMIILSVAVFGVYAELPPMMPDTINKEYNVIAGNYYKISGLAYMRNWLQLFFNPNHTVCYTTDNGCMTEGVWEVRNDTLFIYEYFEIDEEPEFYKTLPDSIRFSPLLLPSYRDLTSYDNIDDYHYPGNYSIFTIKDGGNIIMSVCDDLNRQGRVCSKTAFDKRISYWSMVDMRWMIGKEIIPASLTWDSASVEWPAGVMTVKECVEDSLETQFVVISRDSTTYKVMNPAAFRYPLAEPWRRWAEDWISEAKVGRAERLVLYPVDSIFTLDIPISELRYRHLNTEFMLNEARGYFIAIPLDTLEKYDFCARHYTPTLPRFTTPDPHAESTPSISPYAYCAGNLVMYTDPTGCRFTPRSEPYIEDFMELTKKLREQSSTESLRDEYNTVLTELDAISASPQTFDIRNSPNIDGGATTYDLSTDEVVLSVPLDGEYTNQLLAHELKHGYQFLQGEIDLTLEPFCLDAPNRNLFHDVYDEYDAYKRGSLYGGQQKSIPEILKMTTYRGTYGSPRSWHNTIGFPMKFSDDNARDKALIRIATQFFRAFVFNGVTYRPKK